MAMGILTAGRWSLLIAAAREGSQSSYRQELRGLVENEVLSSTLSDVSQLWP